MIRMSLLLLAIALAVSIFVPQVAVLLLLAMVLFGVVGMVWSASSPFGHRRGGRR